ncbi:MAG TPA: Stp1/IreP family PP2C-type Ser/Thr phosphatase [Myxococcota bacterium]|nr:Stp1/IreP family PP2C-type Ser/Thr phosphatase [Myxococcota bacterium]
MLLRSAARSDVGSRRRVNEDCYAIAAEFGYFVVADGMGGHQAGQLASRLAAEAAVAALEALQGSAATLTEKLRCTVAAANREIYVAAQTKPEYAGMGTTLVSLLAAEGRIALAHVGDSRGYLIRGGRIRQLTDDHSVVGELVRRREITALAAREHPHRHVLTRAIGVRREVAPDLAELTSSPGDLFVLCSDGLTGLVHDEEIAEIASAAPDLDLACGRLVDLANERGGDDNITVILVRNEKQSD